MEHDVLNGLWAERYLFAGLLAAGLSTMAFIPYVFAILHGTAKPDRTCWLIWGVLATLSGGSNLIEGAGTSMIFVASQVGGTLLVCALSIGYGSGHILNKSNISILLVATAGIGTWLLTDTAIFALGMSIGVSALAGTRTIWKSYVAPNSENGRAWGILLIASMFGIYSVGSLNPVLLAYPLYLFTLYGAVMAARWLGGQAINAAQNEAAWSDRRRNVPPITSTNSPKFRHTTSENILAA